MKAAWLRLKTLAQPLLLALRHRGAGAAIAWGLTLMLVAALAGWVAHRRSKWKKTTGAIIGARAARRRLDETHRKTETDVADADQRLKEAMLAAEVEREKYAKARIAAYKVTNKLHDISPEAFEARQKALGIQ